MRKVLRLYALLGLAASPLHAAETTWQRAIRPEDRARLTGLWPAWTKSREQAIGDGRTAEWIAFGALTEPGAPAAGAWPTPGTYRCRLLKLGARAAGMPQIAGPRDIPCVVTADAHGLGIAAKGAAQRSAGRLYPDGDRMVFLGAATLRGDMSTYVYGMDPDRNQVGVLERIGPSRWRLALPWPRWQSTLDVVEIVPVSDGPAS